MQLQPTCLTTVPREERSIRIVISRYLCDSTIGIFASPNRDLVGIDCCAPNRLVPRLNEHFGSTYLSRRLGFAKRGEDGDDAEHEIVSAKHDCEPNAPL